MPRAASQRWLERRSDFLKYNEGFQEAKNMAKGNGDS
jgi:hypothetical protein